MAAGSSVLQEKNRKSTDTGKKNSKLTLKTGGEEGRELTFPLLSLRFSYNTISNYYMTYPLVKNIVIMLTLIKNHQCDVQVYDNMIKLYYTLHLILLISCIIFNNL